MDRRIIFLLLVCVGIFLVIFLSGTRSADQPTITFQGWTNIAGKKHAVVVFQKVRETGPSRIWDHFCKSNYRLRLDFECLHKDDSRVPSFFEESGGNSMVDDTLINVLLSESVKEFRILRAESQLHRYWDILELPFGPPSPKWNFTVQMQGEANK